MQDPKVEQFLNAKGYRWTLVEDQRLADVTLDLNLARWQEKVEEDRVVGMGYTLEAGGTLPAIVVAITDTDKVALLSGRTRIEACNMMAVDQLGAYKILDVLERFELEFLPYSLNALEGRQPQHDTKIQQAIHFVKRFPERDKHIIARDFGLEVKELDDALRHERATDRAVALNVLVEFRKLEPKLRLLVTETVRLDAVCKAAIQCIAFIGWRLGQARGFVKQLVDASSEAAALRIITQAAVDHEELLKKLKRAGQKKPVQTPDQKWFYAARKAAKAWPDHPDVKAFAPADLQVARNYVLDLRGQCNEWLDLAAEAQRTWERSEREKRERDRKDEDGARPSEAGS